MPSAQPTRRANSRTHIALLRGINVGGRNALPMRHLVSMFEDAGCERVRTYIQSGNVVFEAPVARARLVQPPSPRRSPPSSGSMSRS